jgi:hypothetical protein
MLVQIAITGQYWINKGVEDWDGTGEVPQSWRPKGSHTELVVCNVKLSDVASVLAEIRPRINDFGWSNPASSFDACDVVVMPDRLSERELVEWQYKVYDEITSISQADIQAFLKAFNPKMLSEEAPMSPDERFDYLDIM